MKLNYKKLKYKQTKFKKPKQKIVKINLNLRIYQPFHYIIKCPKKLKKLQFYKNKDLKK